MRLVVLGWGNDSRGDDALGPALLAAPEAIEASGRGRIDSSAGRAMHTPSPFKNRRRFMA